MKIEFKKDVDNIGEWLRNIPRFICGLDCKGAKMHPEAEEMRAGDYIGPWVRIEDVINAIIREHICIKCGGSEVYFERFVSPPEKLGYYCQDCGAFLENGQ